MFGSTDYRPPSRFLDEIPAELIDVDRRRRRSAARRRARRAPRGGRRGRDASSRPRCGARRRPGARGAEQLGLRVGDDVAPREVRRGRDRRHRRQRRQGRGASCASATSARSAAARRGRRCSASSRRTSWRVVVDARRRARGRRSTASMLVDRLDRSPGTARGRRRATRAPPHSQWSRFSLSVQPDGCSTLYATMSSSSSASQKPQPPPPVWKYGHRSRGLSRMSAAAPMLSCRHTTLLRRRRVATSMRAGDEEADEQHRDRRARRAA